MKTEPTDIDREAARLFVPAERMLAWRDINGATIGPGAILEFEETEHGQWIRWVGETGCGWSAFPVAAFDADDPATVGVMLAQLRTAHNDPGLRPLRCAPYPGEAPWWEVLCARRVVEGSTEGAALVAAMRIVKATP